MVMKILRFREFINESVDIKIPFNMELPDDILKINKLYKKAGKDLFVVGGAVRDAIMGKNPHDFDLVTNALPNESKEILKDMNVSDEQGQNFGVIRVYTEDCPEGYEIAAYRRDISKGRDTKGDEQKVEMGKHITIHDDVLRRDITINALFYDIENKEIVDLVGGVDDIKNRVIRAVGNPKERFNEDRLRILRTFRFAARTGSKIDDVTSKAILDDNRLKGIGSKDDVSQERIIDEINKVIEHSKKDGKIIMERYIKLLNDYDMWDQIFPNIKINKDIKIEYLDLSIILLDLFWKENINSIKKKLLEYKISTNIINEMIFLQEYYIQTYYIESVYKLAKLKERFHISDELLLNFVKHKKLDLQFYLAFIKYCEDGFIISGIDLMKQGLKGKEIEIEKERLEVERFKNDYLE